MIWIPKVGQRIRIIKPRSPLLDRGIIAHVYEPDTNGEWRVDIILDDGTSLPHWTTNPDFKANRVILANGLERVLDEFWS
jgi:hypothetical protein